MSESTYVGHGRMDGKVVVVTGGASGIGAATCRVFSAEGARVAVIDLGLDAAQALADALPGEAMALAVDVCDSAAVDRALDEVVGRWGQLDSVVHSAGIDDQAAKERMAEQVAQGLPLSISVDLSDESWHRMISVNLDGAFFVLRAALRHMLPAGSGSVVMVGSMGGVEGVRAYPHYAAAKAGLHAMCRSVAVESAHAGVRVNSIAPGPIDTPMRERTPAIMGGAGAGIAPIGRAGRAEEVATVALFLASDDSTYVIGETILVNGGRLTV